MVYFTCKVCRTALSADDRYAGQMMQCPTCRSAQRVPGEPVGAATAATAGGRSTATGSPAHPPRAPQLTRPDRATPLGRRYGFSCPYCSSRLEATESLAATEGQCPTCGSEITIPILDKYGRLIDPKTRQIIRPDPHPVHAYAAAGARAPKVVRLSDGSQHIQCPRCGAYTSISGNNCRQCGMPFTMEGTTADAVGASNGFCVASLVIGILSIPGACTMILPVLAIVLGVVGYNQAASSQEGSGKGLAVAGICCGAVGGAIAAMMILV